MNVLTLEKKYFKDNSKIFYGTFQTKFGDTTIGIFEQRIIYLSFDEKDIFKRFKKAHIIEDKIQSKEYIDDLFENKNVSILLIGTAFQILVWKELLKIPLGTFYSYEQIAQNIGNTKAVRAVGSAIGANPIGYFIPCHRVIRKNGALGGYKWGLELKSLMIEMEKTK